jgi:hypothetical protein
MDSNGSGNKDTKSAARKELFLGVHPFQVQLWITHKRRVPHPFRVLCGKGGSRDTQPENPRELKPGEMPGQTGLSPPTFLPTRIRGLAH